MFFKRSEEPRTEFYRKVSTAFVVVSLLVVGIIFYISFSWATITLTLKEQRVERTISLGLADQTNDEQGVIRGKIREDELEAQGTFTPTQSSEVEQRPQGIITIVNTTSKPQILRETTRLLFEDGETLFRTTELVTVGAKQSKEVRVIADKTGEVNVSGASRFTLPGLWPGLQDKIYGQGFEPKEGGVKTIYTVTQADIDRARGELDSKLKEKFLTLAQTGAFQGDFRPKEQKSVLISKPLIVSLDKPIGVQTDTFTLTVKSKITGIFFDESDVRTAAQQLLQKELQNGYDLVGLDKQAFEYNLDDIDRSAAKARISFRIETGTIQSAEYLALEKSSLTGKSVRQVKAYFDNVPNVLDVDVRLYPFWVTRTPLLHDHINILVQKK